LGLADEFYGNGGSNVAFFLVPVSPDPIWITGEAEPGSNGPNEVFANYSTAYMLLDNNREFEDTHVSFTDVAKQLQSLLQRAVADVTLRLAATRM
jgi:hypothetical protein